MPIINVQMLTGRTAAQKHAFMEHVTQVAMNTLDVPEQAVRIVLIELSPDNWGVGARSMAELRRDGAAGPQPG